MIMQNKLDIKSYIAGLFEGDGQILVSPTGEFNPSFNINFSSKDLELALLIKSWINNYGSIIHKENTVIYTVSCFEGLNIIIDVLNGRLRTPKIYQLKLLLDYLKNNKNIIHEIKPIDESPLEGNSWFAGFTDADGSFDIRYAEYPTKCIISARYRIEQKMIEKITNEDYKYILEKVAVLLKTNLSVYNKKDGRSYYIICVINQTSLKEILKYFEKHPLLSIKYLDYMDWKKVVDLILIKEHTKQTELVKKIKDGMNSKRTYYNWDHLKQFKI